MGYCDVCQSAGSVNRFGFCEICGTEHETAQKPSTILEPVEMMELRSTYDALATAKGGSWKQARKIT